MKKIFSILLFLSGLTLNSQEIKYVTAENGLIVRSKPNTASTRIEKLEFGSEVIIIEKTGIELKIIDDGKEILGEWVQIKNAKKRIQGYVFDGFLKTKKPVHYYTINILGTKVYEKPNFNSKQLTKLPVGQKIIVEGLIKTTEKLKIGENFSLLGGWVKSKRTNGFIFSSDLTKLKPQLTELYKGVFIPNLKGKIVFKKIQKRIQKFEEVEYKIEDEITEFENVTYTYTAFDSCFDHVYLYKNMSLSEVYHQLTIHDITINENTDGFEIGISKFIEKKGNQYLFQGEGATQDLKIIENKDGTFIVSSYDCT